MPGTTPVYGFPYPEPTDLVADYPALGQDLAEDIEAVLPTIGGLFPAIPSTIANSGGTATLTDNTVTFTSVNSVSLNGCFTSSYDTFRIVCVVTASTGMNVNGRLRASGTDASGANYLRTAVYSGSGAQAAFSSGGTSWEMANINNTARAPFTADVYGPATANRTKITQSFGPWVDSSGTQWRAGVAGLDHDVSSAYDGFSLIASTGTMTGTVSVYAYKK